MKVRRNLTNWSVMDLTNFGVFECSPSCVNDNHYGVDEANGAGTMRNWTW